MSKRIVSIGECMIEMAPAAEPDRFGMSFAGDTFNTAWYLRQLLTPDWDVDYVTVIGTDSASRQMLAFMQSSRIGTRHVWHSDDRTVGLYLIELDGTERHFSYWRGQSAARTLADDPARLAIALQKATLVYFSGISLAILDENARRTLLSSISAARRAGAIVAFDPNLRPRLWSDPSAMRDWTMRAAEDADIVLPSYDDEATHFHDASPTATAARYAAQGATLVVVKDGAGAVHVLKDGTLTVLPIPPVENIVDTTAAGDSFNAGFLAAYLERAEVALAVISGSKVAGKVICNRGALVRLS